MTLHRFDVILQPDSNLPADVVINTWHFDEVSAPFGNYDNVRDMLEGFYDTVGPYMPANYLQSQALVRAYDLTQPEPRVPVYESAFTWTQGAGAFLPTEVALVLSVRAEYASGTPNARRRNRKYLGPFIATTNTTAGRPSSALITDLAAAAGQMLNEALASVSWNWVVYSPTEGASYPVIGGWVDDAWDTQRRRGVSPSTRSIWSS